MADGGNSGGWDNIAATIKVEVDGTPTGNVPGRILFTTEKQGSGVSQMTYDSEGNLTVPGAINSQAIKTIATGDLTGGIYAASVNDGTILSTVGAIVSLPTVTADENGKTITIKNVAGTGNITVFGAIYDADETGPSANEIVLDADGEFVTLQYNHSTTTWYAISRNY